MPYRAQAWASRECERGDCNQCKRLSRQAKTTAAMRAPRDHCLSHPSASEPQSEVQRFSAKTAGVRGLNASDGSVAVCHSVLSALVDGYNEAKAAGLLDGDVADYWMQHAMNTVPRLGEKLDAVGRLLHDKVGPSTKRNHGADMPPVNPTDMKEALREADAEILWKVFFALARRNGVSHQKARQKKDEVRVTAIINMLLYFRNQKWSWMARDLSLSLDSLPSTQTDLLNRFGVTMPARSGTNHRRLGAKSHPGAVDAFYCASSGCLISLLIDDFSKICLQWRPNGAPRWDVQMYATLLAKAFPDSPRVQAGVPLHDPDGINVPRVRQYLNLQRDIILDQEFETLLPGECPSARAHTRAHAHTHTPVAR